MRMWSKKRTENGYNAENSYENKLQKKKKRNRTIMILS